MVEYFYVKFRDHSCIGFLDIVRKIRQQTNGGKKNPTPRLQSAWVVT